MSVEVEEGSHHKPAMPRKSTLKKDTGDKKKRKKHGVKLSDKSAIKEFSKLEASSAVATLATQCIPTKGELLTVPSLLPITAQPIYTYPTVEEIRIERERFHSRPDTPELDRKRRTSMLREFALDLGHPRDGSMIPLMKPLLAA